MIETSSQKIATMFPAETYEKKVFNFTKEELALVRTYVAIQTMGEVAGQMIQNILQNVCLPKVGVTSREGVGTVYDSGEGTYTVYIPRETEEKAN